MIEIKNMSCGYGKKEIIQDMNLNINKNEITVILGPNGCGKSTFLKAMAGIVGLKKGEVIVKNQNANEISNKEMAKILSYLPQIRHIPNMSVYDFIMCARYPYLGLNKQPQLDDINAVESAILKVGIEEFNIRHMKTLSGGERQKVYIAFMLAQETDILLLDEPTTYLDISKQFEILDIIANLKAYDKTVVMVLHDIIHGLIIADKIVVMDKGQICFSGNVQATMDSGVLEQIYNIKISKHTIDENEEYIILK